MMYPIPATIQVDHNLSGTGLLKDRLSSASRAFILVDSNTAVYCLPLLTQHFQGFEESVIIEILPGEEHKIQSTLFYILEQLALHGADRKSVLFNLGGGVICDIGGFAASIYKRGISCVNIPTTLLAQIDAAIGGKNGIDFLGYKNIIGTIREPDLVYVSRIFLNTLSEDELKNGIAEAFKHGLVYDEAYWKQISNHPIRDLEDFINRSIAIKSSIVQADPDEKGMRKILNAGHTIAHALEAWNIDNYTPIPHGVAVAAGLIIEAHMSLQLGYLHADEFEEINRCIVQQFGRLPLDEYDFNILIEKMQQDKKNELKRISFSLIRSIGVATYDDFCEPSIIINALNDYRNGR